MGQKVQKGGSYVDTIDGKFNHQVAVTTRAGHFFSSFEFSLTYLYTISFIGNTPDSTSDNVGFRCAADNDQKKKEKKKKNEL